MPEFHLEILDVVAEVTDAQRGCGKVWVYSKITGLLGKEEKSSVDMMRWEDGVFVETRDVQRQV